MRPAIGRRSQGWWALQFLNASLSFGCQEIAKLLMYQIAAKVGSEFENVSFFNVTPPANASEAGRDCRACGNDGERSAYRAAAEKMAGGRRHLHAMKRGWHRFGNSRNIQGRILAAVSDINLKTSDGECVLFCGRSGCGKTTITSRKVHQ